MIKTIVKLLLFASVFFQAFALSSAESSGPTLLTQREYEALTALSNVRDARESKTLEVKSISWQEKGLVFSGGTAVFGLLLSVRGHHLILSRSARPLTAYGEKVLLSAFFEMSSSDRSCKTCAISKVVTDIKEVRYAPIKSFRLGVSHFSKAMVRGSILFRGGVKTVFAGIGGVIFSGVTFMVFPEDAEAATLDYSDIMLHDFDYVLNLSDEELLNSPYGLRHNPDLANVFINLAQFLLTNKEENEDEPALY